MYSYNSLLVITVSREINLEEAVRIKDLGQLGTLIIVSTRTKNQCKTWGRPGIGTFLLCIGCPMSYRPHFTSDTDPYNARRKKKLKKMSNFFIIINLTAASWPRTDSMVCNEQKLKQ